MTKINIRGTIVYPHVFKPYAFDDSNTPKYEASVLIPKTDDEFMKKYKSSINEVIQEKWNGKVPSNLRLPQLTDGDLKLDKDGNKIKAFEGKWILKAKSNKPPMIKDLARQDITDEESIYSGCDCQVVFSPYGYDKPTKGIALGLDGVRKIKDGPKLFSSRPTAADFEDCAEELEVKEKFDDWIDIPDDN